MAEVTVVRARVDGIERRTFEVEEGTTILEAIRAAGLAPADGKALEVGVFNRRRNPGDVVEPGDRIEIYEALQVDPKTARQLRVAAKQGRRRAP
jgi:putative ubiquitin-RnfH superfamily antitoxin RatB of RatAB toxin-antitoxin module